MGKLVVRSGENLQKRVVGLSGVRAHKRCVCALADVVATKLRLSFCCKQSACT